MKLILVRHGETEENFMGNLQKTQGTDNPVCITRWAYRVLTTILMNKPIEQQSLL